MKKVLDGILEGLLTRYKQRVPDVSVICNALVKHGFIGSLSDIENDHIAFRTMGVPHLGIQSLEKIFLHCGYEKRDFYRFEQKKLNAYWFSPPEDHYPRIFISELCVNELSKPAQSIIKSYTDEVTSDPVIALNLDNVAEVDGFLHQPLWRTPTWNDYKTLLDESEYAAWVIYNRYYLNHFTIAVHRLPAPCNTIAGFNTFAQNCGLILNDSGGAIKTSPDGLLIQSATIAQKVEAEFSDGKGGTETHTIAGSYVEFAQREVLEAFKHLPPDQLTRKHRREGFEASNADKIFESTFTHQINKNNDA